MSKDGINKDLGRKIDHAIGLLVNGMLKNSKGKELDVISQEVYNAIYTEKDEDSVDAYYYFIMENHPVPTANLSTYMRNLVEKNRVRELIKIMLKKILVDSIWILEEELEEDYEDEEYDRIIVSIIYNAVSAYNLSKELMSEELRNIFKFVLDAFVFEYGALTYHGN